MTTLLSARPLMAQLLKGGALALIIKVLGAGLSFLMFLALAWVMTDVEFGKYGYAFSLATLLAIIGSFGARNLVLKYVPNYLEKNKKKLVVGVSSFGYILVFTGCASIFLLLCILQLLPISNSFSWVFPSAGVFVFAIGISEYQAFLFRSFGSISLALIPKDVVWKVAVIFSCGILFLQGYSEIAAAIAIVFSSIILLTLCGFQLLVFTTKLYKQEYRLQDKKFDTKNWRRDIWGLWGTSTVQAAAPNLAVVLIGSFLTPEDSGPLFAALRIAMLLNLFLMAGNMIAAPLLARIDPKQDKKRSQNIMNYLIWMTCVPTVVGFVIFVIFGEQILGLFSENYISSKNVLVILSVGYLVNALSGPTAQLMDITGNERVHLKLLIKVQTTALCLLPFALYFWKDIGAAIVISGSVTCTNIMLVVWAQKNMGLNPSITSIFRKNRTSSINI